MPVVKRHAEDLGHGRVEGRLHLIQRIGDDGQVEEQGGVDVVKQGVRRAPLVGEKRVRALGRDGQGLPLLVEGCRGGGIFCGILGMVGERRDLGHCREADDAFDGEVCLVDELPGEVVGRQLVAGGEGEFDQVRSELLKLGVMEAEVGGVG